MIKDTDKDCLDAIRKILLNKAEEQFHDLINEVFGEVKSSYENDKNYEEINFEQSIVIINEIEDKLFELKEFLVEKVQKIKRL